jgi:hypothetical protein
MLLGFGAWETAIGGVVAHADLDGGRLLHPPDDETWEFSIALMKGPPEHSAALTPVCSPCNCGRDRSGQLGNVHFEQYGESYV